MVLEAMTSENEICKLEICLGFVRTTLFFSFSSNFLTGGSSQRRPGSLYRRFVVIVIFSALALLTTIVLFLRIGRSSAERDPMLDPRFNPQIRVDQAAIGDNKLWWGVRFGVLILIDAIFFLGTGTGLWRGCGGTPAWWRPLPALLAHDHAAVLSQYRDNSNGTRDITSVSYCNTLA